MKFNNLNEITEFLYTLPTFHLQGATNYVFDLFKITEFCNRLNNPQNTFDSIHIAGTNGKGSVSSMLSAILQSAQKYTIGLYTSPHLLSFTERIKINGVPITDAYIIQFFEKHYTYLIEKRPSFFEVTTALAFDYFSTNKVDIAVIETGLGGRLDATNIITPLVSVITNVSFDHTEILGNSIEQIAEEKAGIIKERTPIIVGQTDFEAYTIINKIAKEKKASICVASNLIRLKDEGIANWDEKQTYIYHKPRYCKYELSPDLLGSFQKENLKTVIATLESPLLSIKYPIKQEVMQQGISNVRKLTGIKGRFDIFYYSKENRCFQSQKDEHSIPVVIDAAHNAQGIQALMVYLSQYFSPKQLHIILGLVKDKDTKAIFFQLPKQANYYFTTPNVPRGEQASHLQQMANLLQMNSSIHENSIYAFQQALEKATPNDLIVVTGSHYVIANIYSLIEN